MRYRILGSLQVVRDGEDVHVGTYKQRALLALLLINSNAVVSTDRIIDELWGPDAGADRQNALWVNVSGLRSALEPGRKKRTEGTILLTRPPGYMLSVDPGDIDSGEFERLALEGRALVDTDPGAAALVLSEALGLWRGHALEEFTYESFAQAGIARLEELRLTTVEDRIGADLLIGRDRELVGELEGLVRQYPLRQRLVGHLMLALHRSGRQADALRVFAALKTRLGEELGLEPSADIAALEERIVLDDAGPDVTLARGRRADRPEPGLSVRGYELRERIGEGRFGWVYRAYQPAVGRTVAIKVMRPELANNPVFVREFEAEARLAASLDHSLIVPLYDYWREPDAAYVVTRLFPGGSLADLLERGALSSDTAVALVEQIGAALTAAHTRGVVHGSLKPADVLLDGDGNAHLADFGLAVAADPSLLSRTNSNDEFAAPEVRDGLGATERSDVFSYAKIVARTMAGATGEGGGPEAPLVGPAAAVIARAASDHPDDRYETVDTFLAELRAALSTTPLAPRFDSPAVANPYKGLRPFDESDAQRFFGRERLVERLLNRLGRPESQPKLVALVGPSGAGKSSVVRAGLIPAVRSGALPGSDHWYLVTMIPGRHPFEALESALSRVAVDPPASIFERLTSNAGITGTISSLLPFEGAQLLLVVDQLEELFSLGSDAAGAFLNALAEAATDPHGPVRVVVTLRADFYDHPLRHEAFGELLRMGTEVITPMTPGDMERAVVLPASQVGVSFESGLVPQIISDVSGQASSLPLMQYALTELFDARSKSLISADAYRELGGVSAALVSRADALYDGLGGEARVAARDVLLRLVSLGEGSEDTRRRALVSELEELGAGAVREVLDDFGRHRLLAFDRDPVTRGPTVEIAHEALLTEWGRLRDWIDDARSDVHAQRRLASAADEWRERERNPDFLLTGARLTRYIRWLDDPPVRLTKSESSFLESSAKAESARVEEEERQAERDVQLRRRTLLLGGLAVISAVVVALAAFAFNQRSRAATLQADAEASAEQATNLAATLAVTERSLRLATQSALHREDDPELALMLAVESARSTASTGELLATAVDGVHWALQSAHIQYPTIAGMQPAVRLGPTGPTGVFGLAPDDLISFAQDHIGRGFTPDECIRFFSGDPCPDPDAPFPTGLEIAGGNDTYATNPVGLSGLAGTKVVVTSAFSPGFGAEFVQASLDEIGAATGIDVQHRNPPIGDFVVDVAHTSDPGDILMLPQPANMAALNREGLLMDISRYLDVATLADSYEDYLMALSSVGPDGEWPQPGGTPMGVFTNLDAKSLIWFVQSAFADSGYEIPETWADLISLSDQMVADGRTPWCLSIADEYAAASGWPATDWLETAVLRSAGPAFYDQWVHHEVPFDDPAVVSALERIGELAFGEGYVSPAPAAISERTYFDAGFLLSADPPRCLMLPFPNFAVHLNEQLASGGIIDQFDFPALDPRYAMTMVGGGTIAVALSDRPEVRAVIEAMAQPEWGEAWAAAGDGFAFVPANRYFDLSVYPTESGRRIAESAVAAVETGGYRFDGSDSMPTEIGEGAFYAGMLRYFREGPGSAAAVLADIEAAWNALPEPDG